MKLYYGLRDLREEMKMKNKKTLLTVLMFLPLVVTLCALPFLPQSVVIHFDMAGNADGFASKYALLILPIVSIVMGALFFFIGNGEKLSSDDLSRNKKPAIVSGIASLLILNVVNLLLIYIGFNGVPSGDLSNPNTVMTIATSIALIIIGNVMPKTERGSMIGLRTPWSKSSDEAWAVSQRIGGITLIIVGFIVLALTIFVLPRDLSTPVLVLGLLIGTIVSAILSKSACNKLIK